MISFILNNQLIHTHLSPGISLLDFIRYEKDLSGTKIGCREGDCGACTVLEGQWNGKKVMYKSIVSCLTPLGNAHGKHIVTIEGINMKHLSPVQKALVDHSGTQCGFCTPGFVMSLTGHCLSENVSNEHSIIASISGNICRCTGYKSIERAANHISEVLQNKDLKGPIKWLVKNNFLPDYFINIGEQLVKIKTIENNFQKNNVIIGGGTDLMVRKPEEIAEASLTLFQDKNKLKGITVDREYCTIGASTTAHEIMQSQIIQKHIPGILHYFKLISSDSIRHMGTVAGNIMNASPIGDLSIFFIALQAKIALSNGSKKRMVPLKDFFLDYKKLAIKKGEFISSIIFPLPNKSTHINFEKVSKRTHLDIASVNSAISIETKGDKITNCNIAFGGISPIPLFLKNTSSFLIGKSVSDENIIKAVAVLQKEISPIGDVRGSIEYKRLLARQLLFAHFIKLFPRKITSHLLKGKKE